MNSIWSDKVLTPPKEGLFKSTYYLFSLFCSLLSKQNKIISFRPKTSCLNSVGSSNELTPPKKGLLKSNYLTTKYPKNYQVGNG